MPAEGKTTDLVNGTLSSSTIDEFLDRYTIPAERLTSRGICVMFVASAGAGKTTLAGDNIESEYGGRTLIVDVESGSKVLDLTDPRYRPLTMTSWPEIEELTKRAQAGQLQGYKGVILDNLCEIQQKHMDFIAPPGTTIEYKQWNLNLKAMLKFVRDWRDYADANDCNVFFNAWEDEEERKTKMNRLSIMSNPGFQKALPGLIDIVGFINKIEGFPDIRELSFIPSDNTIAKIRAPRNSNLSKIPYRIRYDRDTLPLVDLLALVKGGVPWPYDKYTKFDKDSK